MLKFNDYLKEAALSAKQKKIAAVAGDKDKIDAADLAALRAGKKPVKEEAEELAERDEGKPGKMFAKIADKAAKKYGSKEIGNKVAGAIRQKVLAKEEAEELDEGKMKELYTDMMSHADKKGYSNPKQFTKADYETVGKKHGVSGGDVAIVAGHHTADSYSKLKEAVDTVEKDASGKVKSWSHEGDWKKSTANKDGAGKAANLAGQALNKTKELTKETPDYVGATLRVMDEGKIDNLRDAQALRKDNTSAYSKNYKPDTSHPHIQVVKGSAYGGANQKDDEGDEKKPDNETQEKKGRGRPAGKVGKYKARGSKSVDKDVDDREFQLHLPK